MMIKNIVIKITHECPRCKHWKDHKLQVLLQKEKHTVDVGHFMVGEIRNDIIMYHIVCSNCTILFMPEFSDNELKRLIIENT